MRRLQVIIRLLIAVLLALCARLVIDGFTAAAVISGSVVVALLMAAGWLLRRGRQLGAALVVDESPRSSHRRLAR